MNPGAACALNPGVCITIIQACIDGATVLLGGSCVLGYTCPNPADVLNSEGSEEEKPKKPEGEKLGDLTPEEIQEIQDAVDEAGRPIDVVGSAARGERSEGSDIDHTTAPSSIPYFNDSDLPGIDKDDGILQGAPEKNKRSIRFEPGAKPRIVDN